jgi:SOS response regulatory protein OraA/RecX
MTTNQKIYEYAIWLLSKRSYSTTSITQKIRRKLQQKQILWELADSEISELASKTLSALTDKGLLDDTRHKQIILQRYQSRWGFQKIKMKLRQEGIELTQEDWEQFNGTQENPDQYLIKHLIKAMDKYTKKVGHGAREIQSKVIQHLMQKGHRYEDIKASMRDYAERQNNDSNEY